jgi:RND family efflux transporter MFP subunit
MGMTAKEVDEVLESGHPKPTLPIRSPIDGVIVRLDKALGEGVSADEAILEVHDLSHPWVRAFLAEADAPKIAIGSETRVRLLSDPGFLAAGKVVKSARMLGAQNRTLSVWIEFNEAVPKPLQRNLLARITAITGKPNAALAAPLASIVREQTQSYVFVQKKDNLLERRHVELGRADDRFVEIKNGLTAGELIAVQGAAELQTTYASVR